MSLRELTEAECGQANPLVQLASHATRDHALRERLGASSHASDQMVEEFLHETQMVPQTFQMDGLMREMREIESQRALVPPVRAEAVIDHLNGSNWITEFNVHSADTYKLAPGQLESEHQAIWNELSQAEQSQSANNEKTWLKEYERFRDDSQPVGALYATGYDQASGDWLEKYRFVEEAHREDVFEQAWESNRNEQDLGDADNPQSQFWNKLQNEWKKLAEHDAEDEHPWLSEFEEYYDPYKEYEFKSSNPMSKISEPLQRGKELLEAGDLPGAVLCFEAAVQQDKECAEGWQLLGITQAENEQDPYAICALKKCLELQPDNLTVLMALAVCYTNESFYHQACQSLLSWLKCHPEYSSVVPPDLQVGERVTSLLNKDIHETIRDLFIKAAQRRPVNPDYEVQCGLGVLFNLSGEYNKAADCFRVALDIKPDDARLWNRLGATYANGEQSEKALECYKRALSLSPGFIRARYNVGITCMNFGAYKVACEHFLVALNQQARGQSDSHRMSDTIWISMQMCCSMMDRMDLRDLVISRDLQALNKNFDVNDS